MDKGVLRSWLLHGLGIVILALLLISMPLDAVATALIQVGPKAIVAFFLELMWTQADLMALRSLLPRPIPYPNLLEQEIITHAMGRIIPSAGMGGEPWRARAMSRWIPLSQGVPITVQYRLAHSASGTIFTALSCAVAAALVPGWRTALIALGLVALAIAGATIAVSLSKLPARLLAWAVKRIHAEHPEPRRFLQALAWKLLSRLLQVSELVVYFHLLGLEPTPERVALVAAFLAVSGLIFLMPQGLGVNEAGIAGAFLVLGLPEYLGLTFALLRRARVVAWALFGFALYTLRGRVSRSLER